MDGFSRWIAAPSGDAKSSGTGILSAS